MRQEIVNSALKPIEQTENGGHRNFLFNEDFIGFDGHFPDYPILPAVLQVLLAQMVAEQLVGKKMDFSSLTRAKFSEQLRPDMPIDVRVTYSEEEGHYLCRCELHTTEKRAASFTLQLDEVSES
jgi:3-hydroxyacyl-[acyl-carrier-protein] dehydratase